MEDLKRAKTQSPSARSSESHGKGEHRKASYSTENANYRDRKVHGSRENIIIANYSEHLQCFRSLFFYDSMLKILLHILTHLIFITHNSPFCWLLILSLFLMWKLDTVMLSNLPRSHSFRTGARSPSQEGWLQKLSS